MLDLLFAAGQAASVLLLLYGGGLVAFSLLVAPYVEDGRVGDMDQRRTKTASSA